jgi:hypothetical protein
MEILQLKKNGIYELFLRKIKPGIITKLYVYYGRQIKEFKEVIEKI